MFGSSPPKVDKDDPVLWFSTSGIARRHIVAALFVRSPATGIAAAPLLRYPLQRTCHPHA